MKPAKPVANLTQETPDKNPAVIIQSRRKRILQNSQKKHGKTKKNTKIHKKRTHTAKKRLIIKNNHPPYLSGR